MSDTKRYTVSILGETYTLLSDESESHITHTASTIDHLMREILEKTSISDPKKAAVLAAFKMTSRLIRLEADKEKADKYEDGICHRLINLIDEQTETID